MVTVNDVLDALRRMAPGVRKTPLVRSSALSASSGGDVWLKAENLQHTGSFKVRGASNRIGAMSDDERARGVVAASAGNHAQGVAIAARAYGAKATIVMPVTTPLAKVEATRDYGAEVILDGESYDAAFARARAIADERGAQLIHAFEFHEERCVEHRPSSGVGIRRAGKLRVHHFERVGRERGRDVGRHGRPAPRVLLPACSLQLALEEIALPRRGLRGELLQLRDARVARHARRVIRRRDALVDAQRVLARSTHALERLRERGAPLAQHRFHRVDTGE
jgi:hypothetical protein